jgi:hypothetical protein
MGEEITTRKGHGDLNFTWGISPLLYGPLPARGCASSTCSLLPTRLRATGWWSTCTGRSRMPCVHVGQAPAWHSHLRYTLGAAGTTCRAKGGFCNIIIRTGDRSLPYPPRATVAHARPSKCERASATYAAGILLQQLLMLRELIRQEQSMCTYMQVGGQQKPLTAPYAGPYQVVAKRGEDLHHPGGPEAGDLLKALTGSSPVSTAEAATRGRPTKKPAAPTSQPCDFMKPQTGGACGGIV